MHLNEYTNSDQKDIILIKFPYSDFSIKKLRPVLIISNNKYNLLNKDVIACCISSKIKKRYWNIKITNDDLINKLNNNKNIIKIDSIYKISKEEITNKISKLKEEKFKEIIKKIKELF